MKSYDCAIIGLGAVGSAAAFQLSKSGQKVIGFDKFSPPHTNGSSHGDTRITRQAIGEGSVYSPIALLSNAIWREIETQTGEDLFTACGGLLFGPRDVKTTQHRKVDFLGESIRAAEQYNVPHEVLDIDDLKRRFPQFCYEGNEFGYYEPGAGFLRPERCVQTQLELAKTLGATIHFDEAVLSIEPTGGDCGVRITTSSGEYFADAAVVSSGAWVQEFLPENLKKHFQVFRQVLFWFEVEGEVSLFSKERFPVYIRLGHHSDDMFYGFPAIDGPNGGIKVAAEQFEEATSADNLQKEVSPSEIEAMVAHIKRYLPITNRCIRSAACLYTVTPDSDFVIDRLPDSPQIILASPCSGHGFKHSAGIGKLLSELVVRGETSLDISSFNLRRLT